MNENSPLLDDLMSIDGTKVASKGALFDEDLIVRVSNSSVPSQLSPVLEGPLKDDLWKILEESNYKIVYELKKDQKSITDVFACISVASPIIRELVRMRSQDFYTYRHIFMTTSLTILVAGRLSVPRDKIERLAHAALVHDFGKMRIPLNVLQSKERLSRKEYRYIYQHPILGCLLLHHYYGKNDPLASEASLKHHEYPNGSGYPLGTIQTDEDLGIITANDIFDALISPRCYREEAYNIRGAIDHLWDGVLSGQIFERPVKVLISLNRKDKPDWTSINVHSIKKGLVPIKNNYGPVDEGKKE